MIPRRIRLSRAKGWRKPADAVVVARPTKWGNPWRVGNPGTFWLPNWPVKDQPLGCALDAADAVTLFRNMLTGGPDPVSAALPETFHRVGRIGCRNAIRAHAAAIIHDSHELRGRDLACWCPLDAPCHAQVLLELANGGRS